MQTAFWLVCAIMIDGQPGHPVYQTLYPDQAQCEVVAGLANRDSTAPKGRTFGCGCVASNRPLPHDPRLPHDR